MSRKDRRRQAKHARALDYEELYRSVREHHAAVRLEPARTIYDRVLADDNPHALELFGDVALRHQEFERAAALIRKSIDLGTPSSSLYSELALAYMGDARYEAAEAALARALEMDPDDFRAWINLGILYRDQGRLDEATAALQSATSRNPNHANAHLHLAEAKLRTKHPVEALECVETALLLAPGSTWGLALQSVALCELGEGRRFQELVAYEELVHLIDAGTPEGFTNLSVFNGRLARHIRRHPTLHREPAGFSTRGGSQTLGNLLRDPTPVVRSLERLIDAALAGVLDGLAGGSSHPQVAKRPGRYRLEGWGVRLDPEGCQDAHIHRDGWWSGVYYVDLGGVVDEESREGWLELGAGPDSLYAQGSRPDTLLVRPEEGRFVVFPSYLWHRTIPFQRAGTRVSFAFDVIPV